MFGFVFPYVRKSLDNFLNRLNQQMDWVYRFDIIIRFHIDDFLWTAENIRFDW